MPRARNLKPGFFKNEDLAECSYPARLLFSGLWTLADREGRLENRPKRIKGEIFPFDTIAIAPLLDELEEWSFITRYEVAGLSIIQIVNFAKHQQPHGTEKDGELPDPAGMLTVHQRGRNGYATGETTLQLYAKTGKAPSSDGTESGALTVNKLDSTGIESSALTVKEQGRNTLNPESLLLNPESLNTPPPPKGGKGRSRNPGIEVPEGFDAWYALYRRKDARADAVKAWRQLSLDTDETLRAKAMAAVKAWRWAEDKTKIPLPASWLRGERWNDEAVARAVAAVTGISASTPAGGEPWWAQAGFDGMHHANNFQCYEWNHREFCDGQRIEVAA